MLRNNTYKWMYRSFDSDFEKDFFYPSYVESIHLERASGYFSLNSLLYSLKGLVKFIERGGDIFLVCNPDLSAKDISLIDAGTSIDDELVISCLVKKIEEEDGNTDEDFINGLDVICNMIAERRLIIKIAFKERGIYHEKIGIFYDEEGNKVYFNGSANQTRSALTDNFESFQVTYSWRDELSKTIVEEEALYFMNIWNNLIEKLNVIDFPEAVKQKMFRQYKRSATLQHAINKYKKEDCDTNTSSTTKASKKELYSYQKQAIDEFVNNAYCHFYEMATGTGKTYTAIKTIERLERDLDKNIFTMILVPQVDLQTQWKNSLIDEGYEQVFLLGGLCNDSDDEYNKAMIQYFSDETVACVAVYDTFFSKICSHIEDEIDDLFLIVDEAHNISANQYKKLPKGARYRLGLSATIKRFSEDETQKILSYFTDEGREPFYYGIEDAIDNNFLSKYNYTPLYVRLTEEEFKSYQRYTRSIATEMNKSESERDKNKLESYRRDRSLIVKQASNKVVKLQELIDGSYNFVNSVVYCGQGKDKEADSDQRIIDVVTKMLGDSGLRVSKFVSTTPNRKEVLEEFESGFYDTLVAIKCFDEGVDVPKLDKIFIMASEGALRQTVQRRGRVLRKCKETGKEIAQIYDMIALPSICSSDLDMGAASLIKNEFRRVLEYNRLAENGITNNDEFESILNKYNVTREDIENDGTAD